MSAPLPPPLESAFTAIEEALTRLGALSLQEHVASADDLEVLAQQKSHWSTELNARFEGVQRALAQSGHAGTLRQLAAKAKTPALKQRVASLLAQFKQVQNGNAVSREIIQRKLNASRALAFSLMSLHSEQPVLADAPLGAKQFSGVTASRRAISQA